MANFSWKNHVSVLRISLNNCRSSEKKLQGTGQTNEQIATVLKMLFNKMQACSLKTNLFILFASKFFEKCFSITCILRPVCAIIQKSNLNKEKTFLFFDFFRILIEENFNMEWNRCPVVKTALSVSKGTVWEGYLVFKKNCLNQLSKIFCKVQRNVFNTVAKTAHYKSGWTSQYFQVS